MAQNDSWVLTGLLPHPTDEWKKLRHFLAISPEETAAMVTTIEPLFRRGHELVVGTYDYLAHHEETAVILAGKKALTRHIWPNAAAFSPFGWRGCLAWILVMPLLWHCSGQDKYMPLMGHATFTCQNAMFPAQSVWYRPHLPGFCKKRCQRRRPFLRRWLVGTRYSPCTSI